MASQSQSFGETTSNAQAQGLYSAVSLHCCSLLTLVLCSRFSVYHSSFRGALALPWTYQWPETLQRSTCSGTEHFLVLWPYYSLSSSLPLFSPLFSPHFPLLRIFCLFLNVLFQSCHKLGWWAQLHGVPARQLEVALSGMGQPHASSHWGHSSRLSAAKTLLFTSCIASKGWAQKYSSYKYSNYILLCSILREGSTELLLIFRSHPINTEGHYKPFQALDIFMGTEVKLVGPQVGDQVDIWINSHGLPSC